jgi:hypothetical protein
MPNFSEAIYAFEPYRETPDGHSLDPDRTPRYCFHRPRRGRTHIVSANAFLALLRLRLRGPATNFPSGGRCPCESHRPCALLQLYEWKRAAGQRILFGAVAPRVLRLQIMAQDGFGFAPFFSPRPNSNRKERGYFASHTRVDRSPYRIVVGPPWRAYVDRQRSIFCRDETPNGETLFHPHVS